MKSIDTRDGDLGHLDEELTVVLWRTERLVALGYELREAAVLAFSHLDIHELESLIAKGCPPSTAVRIAA
jgi:hypothetical protein